MKQLDENEVNHNIFKMAVLSIQIKHLTHGNRIY